MAQKPVYVGYMNVMTEWAGRWKNDGVSVEVFPGELVKFDGLPGEDHPTYLREKPAQMLLELLSPSASVADFLQLLRAYRIGYSVGHSSRDTIDH